MWSICFRPLSVCGWLLVLAACTTQATPAYPRPSLALPDAIAERYRVPDSVREELRAPIGKQQGIEFFRGRLGSESEKVEFHLLIPESDSPRPLMLLLPILAGGENLMWMLGWDLAQKGYAVAWTRRVARAMRRGDRAPELEELFRRTVVQNRMLLQWLRQDEAVDPARMGLVGISLGGIVGGVMLALEPDLAGGALCLAGGDLPDLIIQSTETRVARWREWRFREDGLGSHELLRELATYLVSDPASLGAYVATDRVFLIGALLDEVVPIRNQDLLWESLGRPRRLLLPLGHYTAAIGMGALLNHVDEFLKDRFERRAATPTPPVVTMTP